MDSLIIAIIILRIRHNRIKVYMARKTPHCDHTHCRIESDNPFGYNVYNCTHQMNWKCIASEISLLNSDMLSTHHGLC